MTDPASTAAQRPLPEKIGRYRILCELGQGGMAVLYLGRAVGPGGFERLFAIKMIHEHLCRERAFINMFLDEARVAARVQHPNVIPVYEVDVDRGRYYLAMDYVSGETLSHTLGYSWRSGRPFPLHIAAALMASACEGLHAAHELRGATGELLGVVHRDVAPQNIMIGYDGIVRLMDFGVAKAEDQLAHSRPGTMKGTVAYMAPEHLRSQPLDRRADIFSAGVVLWETCVGKRLFKAKNDIDTAARVLKMPIPLPSALREAFPPRLEEIILRALKRHPDQRQPTARALGEDLQDFLVSEQKRVSAADLERFMKEIFPERWHQRIEMERRAIAPVPEAVQHSLFDTSSDQGLVAVETPNESALDALTDEVIGAIDPADLPSGTTGPIMPLSAEDRTVEEGHVGEKLRAEVLRLVASTSESLKIEPSPPGGKDASRSPTHVVPKTTQKPADMILSIEGELFVPPPGRNEPPAQSEVVVSAALLGESRSDGRTVLTRGPHRTSKTPPPPTRVIRETFRGESVPTDLDLGARVASVEAKSPPEPAAGFGAEPTTPDRGQIKEEPPPPPAEPSPIVDLRAVPDDEPDTETPLDRTLLIQHHIKFDAPPEEPPARDVEPRTFRSRTAEAEVEEIRATPRRRALVAGVLLAAAVGLVALAATQLGPTSHAPETPARTEAPSGAPSGVAPPSVPPPNEPPPRPAEAAPTEAAPSQAAPSEAAPSEAAPSEPVPTIETETAEREAAPAERSFAEPTTEEDEEAADDTAGEGDDPAPPAKATRDTNKSARTKRPGAVRATKQRPKAVPDRSGKNTPKAEQEDLRLFDGTDL